MNNLTIQFFFSFLDLKNTTSQFTGDTSAMRGKEGINVQKRKYIDLSFLDVLDIEKPSVKRPALDDTGTVNPSVTSQFTKDTSAMRGEEGNNVQKRKYIDLSFSDDLDIEEILKNLPPLDDTETVTPKVQKISKKSRKVEPSLLVQLLKGLTTRKAKKYRMNNRNEYFNNGRGLCCNNNCCMRWKYVDIKRILSKWI